MLRPGEKGKKGGRDMQFCGGSSWVAECHSRALLVELLFAVGVRHLALDVGQDRSVGLGISKTLYYTIQTLYSIENSPLPWVIPRS